MTFQLSIAKAYNNLLRHTRGGLFLSTSFWRWIVLNALLASRSSCCSLKNLVTRSTTYSTSCSYRLFVGLPVASCASQRLLAVDGGCRDQLESIWHRLKISEYIHLANFKFVKHKNTIIVQFVHFFSASSLWSLCRCCGHCM